MVEALNFASGGKIAVLIGISDYSDLCLKVPEKQHPNMISCL